MRKKDNCHIISPDKSRAAKTQNSENDLYYYTRIHLDILFHTVTVRANTGCLATVTMFPRSNYYSACERCAISKISICHASKPVSSYISPE